MADIKLSNCGDRFSQAVNKSISGNYCRLVLKVKENDLVQVYFL